MKDPSTIVKFVRRLFPALNLQYGTADYGHVHELAWERNGLITAVRWHKGAMVSPMDIARKILPSAYPGTAMRIN